MAKIHTHYDNLKVARKAPQEVIRAAYKALSQKYHPDKNPGDEKAARIMAILNSAYGTLADPVRRREHDEWIAAEEWEIAWLESTRAEEGRELVRADNGWEPQEVNDTPAYRRAHNIRLWGAMALCGVAGCVLGAVLASQLNLMPVALAGVMGKAPAKPAAAAPAAAPVTVTVPAGDPAVEGWAVTKAHSPEATEPPLVKSLGVAEFVIPARKPDCDLALSSLVAPNGEQWPAESGYLTGFPVANEGKDMEISVDNADNPSPVLVKVYDVAKRATVRHVYLKPNDSLTLDKLAAGRYEVRYQNIEVGASGADCLVRRKPATMVKAPASEPAEGEAKDLAGANP